MTDSIDITRSQLFLDDQIIEDSANVSRVWHRPKKYPKPVIEADRPWEFNCPVAYGTVIHRDGLFRIWYCGWTRHIPPVVCYAESSDGVHWVKPDLGLIEFSGSRHNNIVLQSFSSRGLIDDISVVEDPEDTEWPLKALYWANTGPGYSTKGEHGIFAAQSRDGIEWHQIGNVLPNWGDRFNAAPSKINGRFVVFGRAPRDLEFHGLNTVSRGRVVWRTESTDLKRWSEPELVLSPDTNDPPYMQFYSATVFPYSDLVLGSIERMHMTPDVLDTELIWSKDGRTWNRSGPRLPLIELGTSGSFDSEWVNLPSNGPIRRGNELWFYYSGRSAAHSAIGPLNHGAIGLSIMRSDGFCSMKTTEQKGAILTKPFTWMGDRLQVNMDARRSTTSHPRNLRPGSLRVEIRDEQNKVVPGFELANCIAMNDNTYRDPECFRPVLWNANPGMKHLAGTRVRLLFEMSDMHLFSFRSALDQRD